MLSPTTAGHLPKPLALVACVLSGFWVCEYNCGCWNIGEKVSSKRLLTHLFMSSYASATCGAHGERSGTPLSATRDGFLGGARNTTELLSTTNGLQACEALHKTSDPSGNIGSQVQSNASSPGNVCWIGGLGLSSAPIRPAQPAICLKQPRPRVTFSEKVVRRLWASETPSALRLGKTSSSSDELKGQECLMPGHPHNRSIRSCQVIQVFQQKVESTKAHRWRGVPP